MSDSHTPSSFRFSDRSVRILRLAALVLGVAALLVTILADRRSGRRSGFGEIQLMVLSVGGALVLASLAGRRLPGLYRRFAAGFLGLIVMVVALEVGAAVLQSLPGPMTRRERAVSFYDRNAWGPTHLREVAIIDNNKRYDPDALWRFQPFNGNTITIDSAGLRVTPGALCTNDAYRVFLFGGSTMWGVGSRDFETIPAYLQAELSRNTKRAVCVENYAGPGFVSSQSVGKLLALLRAGQRPDVVVSYLGVNDVRAAYLFGRPGWPIRASGVAYRVDHKETLGDVLSRTHLISGLRRLYRRTADSIEPWTPPVRVDPDTLAAQTVSELLTTHRMLDALGRQFGYTYLDVWEPVVWAGHKSLTADERPLLTMLDSNLVRLYRASQAQARRVAGTVDRLIYLGDVFDGEAGTIWIDWSHVTAVGNRIVAHRIAAALDSTVKR